MTQKLLAEDRTFSPTSKISTKPNCGDFCSASENDNRDNSDQEDFSMSQQKPDRE